MSWNHNLEMYFKTTGEKAHGLSILHKSAEAYYDRRKMWIDIPVIVGSGVIAFLNAGSSAMFHDDSRLTSIGLGVGSFVLGFLQTLSSYFQLGKKAEGHRITAIQYAKLYRLLHVELSLPRNERMPPHTLLKTTTDGFDRLQEIQPILPPPLLEKFRKDYDKPEYKDIARPDETNGLERVVIHGTDEIVSPFVVKNPVASSGVALQQKDT